jgi:ABC-type bacteriocin/lantibiotic exporter with double-glycine peptidase domain
MHSQHPAAFMSGIERPISRNTRIPAVAVKVGSATGGGISGGQKRKLMLGVELLALPEILFLDEPTSVRLLLELTLLNCSSLDHPL